MTLTMPEFYKGRILPEKPYFSIARFESPVRFKPSAAGFETQMLPPSTSNLCLSFLLGQCCQRILSRLLSTRRRTGADADADADADRLGESGGEFGTIRIRLAFLRLRSVHSGSGFRPEVGHLLDGPRGADLLQGREENE